MPDILLKVLSIIGIILLVLLGILLVLILLVLFVPLVYRADGRKDSENLKLHVRIRWMFGLFRVTAQYSSDFQLKVKLLWFTLFDIEDYLSDTGEDADTEKEVSSKTENSTKTEISTNTEPYADGESATDAKFVTDAESVTNVETVTDAESVTDVEKKSSLSDNKDEHGICQKIEYKFRLIYDKIKNILEKIREIFNSFRERSNDFSYYKELLEEKNTRELFKHVCARLGKVCRALKPRKCKADILFGTGAPDTTGYAYGIYGMLSPHLGNDIYVTPDFTRAVFEGSFAMSGHIMVFTILIQTLCIVMDKRLHLFIDKVKRKQNTK